MVIIIANVIDFLAAGLQVGSGAIKEKSKILVVQTVQLLMQAVSMLLLGGVTGAVSNVLSCWRNYLCYKDKLSSFWKGVLIAASIIMTVLLNEQGLLGILPAAVCTGKTSFSHQALRRATLHFFCQSSIKADPDLDCI